MSARNISCWVKEAGAWGWQPYHVPIVMKSGTPILLEPSGPVEACTGTDLPVPFTTTNHKIGSIPHSQTHYQLLHSVFWVLSSICKRMVACSLEAFVPKTLLWKLYGDTSQNTPIITLNPRLFLTVKDRIYHPQNTSEIKVLCRLIFMFFDKRWENKIFWTKPLKRISWI
jgi:hypothetical protein